MHSAFSALQALPPEEQQAALAGLGHESLDRLMHDWLVWARDDQIPPLQPVDGNWRTWLVLGGRGAGKTRTGSEWVRAIALGLAPLADFRAHRIALVGLTLGQVRSVMVEGVSGLLRVHRAAEMPRYEVATNTIIWPNGTIAQMFAADDPDSLRGPQFDAAWCDELAKWRRAERAWDNLQLALRLGPSPQAVITTTPRPLPLLKRLIEDPATVVSRSKTADNSANLAPRFVADMQRRYGATALGRQELDGEIVEERFGGLWRREWIDAHRLVGKPDLRRIVVAVDPPVTATGGSDACGIVVAGLGVDGRAYVLADRTIRGREPIVWARAAVAAYRDFAADRIVAEVNQGGNLVANVLRQVDGLTLVGDAFTALYFAGSRLHVGQGNQVIFRQREVRQREEGVQLLCQHAVWLILRYRESLPMTPNVCDRLKARATEVELSSA